MTSVLGQGCNTALSTCTALDKAMAASNLDDPDKIDDALDHYNSVWLPEAHALQRLEFMSVRPGPLPCAPALLVLVDTS